MIIRENNGMFCGGFYGNATADNISISPPNNSGVQITFVLDGKNASAEHDYILAAGDAYTIAEFIYDANLCD